MKDRFALVGALALLFAVVSSLWLAGSRATPPIAQTSTPVAADVEPTAEPVTAATAIVAPPISEALVVSLDGLGGASASAQPGDHVTLLGFIAAELNQGEAVTRVVLADVTVLQGSSADTSLTLAVSPEQALFVRSAQTLGVRMFAALRPADGSIAAQVPEVVSNRDLGAILRTRP